MSDQTASSLPIRVVSNTRCVRCQGATKVQRIAACIVPAQDTVPYFLGRLGKPEQFPILRIDDAFVHEEIYVEGTTPIGFADQHDRNRLDFSGLYES